MYQLLKENEEMLHLMKKMMLLIQVNSLKINKTNIFLIFLEDIDPNVGRFRNLVQTTVIISKVNYH
jgi:hypothetical protein